MTWVEVPAPGIVLQLEPDAKSWMKQVDEDIWLTVIDGTAEGFGHYFGRHLSIAQINKDGERSIPTEDQIKDVLVYFGGQDLIRQPTSSGHVAVQFLEKP